MPFDERIDEIRWQRMARIKLRNEMREGKY